MTGPTDSTDGLAERLATSIDDHLGDSGDSRRGFLGRTVLAGGTLLALGGGSGVAVAADEHEQESDGGESGAAFDDVAGTDVDVVNYALTLEHLEDVFYREALETFSEDDFVNASALEGYSEENRQMAYGFVETVAEHEASHVDVLTQTVELLGGDPAPECTYSFDVETVGDFLGLAQVFENTGVGAYAGAAPFIESPDLLSAALSIHSVEARHAAVFNTLNGESPFPNAYDPALSQEEVLDAVSGFIESCPEEGGEMPENGSGNGMNGNGEDSGMAGNETAGNETAGNETSE